MDLSLSVEVTVTRIGGPTVASNGGSIERQWGPRIIPIITPGYRSDWVGGANDSRSQLNVQFEDFRALDEEFGGGQVQLSDMNNAPIGRRPFLLYRWPYDVPTYTTIKDRLPDPYSLGLYQLALRVIGAPPSWIAAKEARAAAARLDAESAAAADLFAPQGDQA